MRTKLHGVVFCLFFMLTGVSSQINLNKVLNDVKKKTEKKIEQRIERKADKAVDKTLDKVEEKAEDAVTGKKNENTTQKKNE